MTAPPFSAVSPSRSLSSTGRLHRRDWLSLGASAAAAALLAPRESARGFFANDTIEVACLGTGGRCRQLMSRLAQMPGVRMAAVCDVWDKHRAMGQEIADKKAIVETEYRKLLDRSDIDAVLIGAPDHWHVPMTVDACEAGKDVYVEKPLTHTIEEGQRVIDAQNHHKRIVQVGTQQRSMPHLIEAREIVQSGALGTIHKIHMTWNRNQERWAGADGSIDPRQVRWDLFLGNAPDQPFDAYRFRNWRWFWDFGGGIFTDLMVHWLDTAVWMLDLDEPATAMSVGDHFATEGLWQTPDTVQTLLRYPGKKIQAHFEGTFVNHHNRAMLEIMGTDATLYVDRGRYELTPQRGKSVPPRERIDDTRGLRGADFFEQVDGETYHLTNWLDCVRSRQRPACPAEAGVRAALGAHLANQSLRTGQVATL